MLVRHEYLRALAEPVGSLAHRLDTALDGITCPLGLLERLPVHAGQIVFGPSGILDDMVQAVGGIVSRPRGQHLDRFVQLRPNCREWLGWRGGAITVASGSFRSAGGKNKTSNPILQKHAVEVDEQTEIIPAQPQVSQNLRAMKEG